MNHQTIIVKKKKAPEQHAHHGGSWKVAYADFVTAMMAFFMVMWIMGLSDETRAIIQGYFNDPLGFMKNEPRSRTVVALPGLQSPKPGSSNRDGELPFSDNEEVRKLREKISHEFKRASAASPELAYLIENIEVSVTEEGLRMEFVESTGAVFFESGSDKIRPAALGLIKKIGPVLRHSGRKMVLEGHTDASPYPSQQYTNWDLSADRANAFRRALFDARIDPRQFQEVRAFADTRLRNRQEPTHFSNRRVSLLLPFHAPGEVTDELPKEVFKDRIQGAFRRPIAVAPEPVSVRN